MDEFTADAFVNRDEPIPVLVLEPPKDPPRGTEDGYDDGHREGKRDWFRGHASTVKESIMGKTSEKGLSMQDRLLEKLLQQVIPSEDPHEIQYDGSTNFIQRPNFNITTMSNNFRRFNARIGVVFVFQAQVLRLLSWKHSSHTLSFLAVYTFVCLDPYLLSVIPFFIIILALLVPSFVARHPAPPSTTSETVPYSPLGPPIAPAPTVKPVKELSKDFFRNMRDLQNSMEDFSQLHDNFICLLTPRTNFSNEALSSIIFVVACFTTAWLCIASHLMPWRFMFLVIGWTITCAGHPTLQRKMLSAQKSSTFPPSSLKCRLQTLIDRWIAHDIILDTPPETREAEIFELQKLSPSSGEWESWVFSSTPYDPLSAAKLAGSRPQGTRFFEDVRAPEGWEWSEKKWALDLWSREWVEERIITGVEVETEGERWIYDIRYEEQEDEGDDEFGMETATLTPTKGKGKGKQKEKMPIQSSEEGIDGSGRRGEWRRRRWVRMVKRRSQSRSMEVKP